VKIRLCDAEHDSTGICVEIEIVAEPFAESVPYVLTLWVSGNVVAHVAEAALTPAELYAFGHALLDAAADGFGNFLPSDEVFGIDLAPPTVPRALDEVAVTAWVDAGRSQARAPTRSGVGVQLVVDAHDLAGVAEAVCDQAARVLAA
jgi:hypothetical protein